MAMPSGGRGAALRKFLESQSSEPEKTAPPTANNGQVLPVAEPTRPLGRGAIFSKFVGGGDPSFAPPVAHPSSATSGITPAPLSVGRGRSLLMAMGAAHLTPSSSISNLPYSPTIQKDQEEVQRVTQSLAKAAISPPPDYKGSFGQSVDVICNYIKLSFNPGQGVYMYEVKFDPPVDARASRFGMLNEHTNVLGDTKSFDGTLLYLPKRLPDKVTEFDSKLKSDGSPIKISVVFKKETLLGEMVNLLNILFKRAMHALELHLVGDSYYDPKARFNVPAHRLEIWPGYVTAVNEYQGGIMLCCDASFKVLRTQTVYELLEIAQSINKTPTYWQKDFVNMIVGSVVLTRFNNKTYRIDDVDFSRSPTDTFENQKGEKISFIDYYQKQYRETINDKSQPLLISKVKGSYKGKTVSHLICLIPELCYMTGLTEEMKADTRIMKDIAQHTRITPNQRLANLKTFIKNINTVEEARTIFSNWGLRIDDGAVDLKARALPPETIYFLNGENKGVTEAEWSRASTSNKVLSAVDLNNWMVVFTRNDDKSVQGFVDMMKKCGGPMGMKVQGPQLCPLPDDKTDKYVNAIRSYKGRGLQIVVIIFPFARNDKYSAVKKLCCHDEPLLSQVILSKTIRRPDRLRPIVQKVALQMNCKLGGTLWAVKIPLKNTMIVGMDTYHDPTHKGSSVGAVVASINESMTRWYSKVCNQGSGAELISGLEMCMISCLTKYREVNGTLPDQIAIFRDGVSHGELPYATQYEFPQLKSACQRMAAEYNPKFLFVIVQKRVSTRIFFKKQNGIENPPPGTVLDHTVTLKEYFDFYLVSQNVRQGTVTPTHYIVLCNSTSMGPDQVQRLAYKLTHLYYNWPGTVRVPAPCQYAHKLAYLIGESVHKEAAETLADKLFYL